MIAVDDDVSSWVAGSVPSGVEWVARAVTRLGGWVGVTVVLAAAFVALRRASRRADAVFTAAAVLGITLIVPVLKAVYGRARPDLADPADLPHSYSFPSGHAANAVVLYGALGLLAAEGARSRWGSVAWLGAAALGALAIGSTRVLLNVHFVSDVVAGFAVGLAWLCCCLIARDVLAKER